MENEREGYDKMQGNFGMPDNIAGRAKERCTELFDIFQLQADCMEKEKKDYEKQH
jgi:hypothetical protein